MRQLNITQVSHVATVEWSTADLVRRIERALELANSAISLISEESLDIDLEALEAPPDKVIAETAMFLRVVSAIPNTFTPNVSEYAHKLICALLPLARSSRVAVRISLHPSLAQDYGAAHILLSKAGYPDLVFDKIILAALATSSTRERLPHRELEQAWFTWLLNGPLPSGDLIARTALARGIDLITGNRDELYAFTHTLLYATDFGNSATKFPISTVNILSLARSALAGALDDDDFDLAGEILLTWPFLRVDWDFTSSLAFVVLTRVEDDVGVLPSLALDQARYERQPSTSRTHYVTALAYHTAYVMGLLCSATLFHRNFPNTRSIKPSGSNTFAEELLVTLDTDKRQPQWLKDFKTLPRTSWAAHSSFLLDVSLRRAVRKLDLSRVQQLLEDGVKHEIPLTPLCLQAAEILSRLAGLSTFARIL